MDKRCGTNSTAHATDWAGNWRTLAGFWGIPAAVMLAAALLEPVLRAAVWSAMLTWMGLACILNARRCARTHCRFTGPFLLLMAALVIAYTAGVLPIGAHGWTFLGGTTIAGSAAIWWGSERIWGVFSPRNRKTAPRRS
ncbi:MAG: hypothetical protein ACREEP_01055 [Dongiaceae bacterium]